MLDTNDVAAAKPDPNSKRKLKPAPRAPVSEYPLADEVHRAIKKGKTTFAEIHRHTGRRKSDISDALAHLLLTSKSIRTAKRGDGVRLYLPASAPAACRKDHRATTEPALSFSTLQNLMPYRATRTAGC